MNVVNRDDAYLNSRLLKCQECELNSFAIFAQCCPINFIIHYFSYLFSRIWLSPIARFRRTSIAKQRINLSKRLCEQSLRLLRPYREIGDKFSTTYQDHSHKYANFTKESVGRKNVKQNSISREVVLKSILF